MSKPEWVSGKEGGLTDTQSSSFCSSGCWGPGISRFRGSPLVDSIIEGFINASCLCPILKPNSTRDRSTHISINPETQEILQSQAFPISRILTSEPLWASVFSSLNGRTINGYHWGQQVLQLDSPTWIRVKTVLSGLLSFCHLCLWMPISLILHVYIFRAK